jgi:uncharacterized cupin superfamily protein
MKTTDDIVSVSSAGVEKESYPPAPEKLISGNPRQNIWNVYSSGDAKFHSGIWDAEAGQWHINYTEDEYCMILEGESVIADEQGKERTVKAGDQFVIPSGFKGTWTVPVYCKKIYVIYEA